MRTRKLTLIPMLALACSVASCSSCGPKPTPVAKTPFTDALRAADDIAMSIKLLTEAERNLETQHLITPQEGLKIIDALTVLHGADVRFVADLDVARAANSKSAAVASGKALVTAIGGLTSLTIHNPDAKRTLDRIMATVNIALGVLQTFVE